MADSSEQFFCKMAGKAKREVTDLATGMITVISGVHREVDGLEFKTIPTHYGSIVGKTSDKNIARTRIPNILRYAIKDERILELENFRRFDEDD